MNRWQSLSTPALAAMAIFVATILTGSQPADAAGTNILTPIFNGWLFGSDEERRVAADVTGVEPNSGVPVFGVRCNYGYVMRGGERVRQEICESTR